LQLPPYQIPLMVPYLLLVALSATAAPTSPDAALMELLQSLSLKTPAGAGQSYGGRTELVARDPVKFFFRTLDDNKKGSVRPIEKGVTLKGTNLDFLGGLTHLRLLPGSFPSDMHFHFDGLATVLKLAFTKVSGTLQLSYNVKAFESNAEKDYDSCSFFGSGTGPTNAKFDHLCLQNPAVNLLPIKDELWLTIDTTKWGRINPDTLETIPATVNVNNISATLNAHPACDPRVGVCYVQHPCPPKFALDTPEVCFSELVPNSNAQGDMGIHILSRSTAPHNLLLQHSHSPCVTPNYLVSKLDSFEPRSPINLNAGALKFSRQKEDNVWLVMDRRTNASRVLTSNAAFVNNHFWNCAEREDGSVIVETVAATHDYLDNYFRRNLARAKTPWAKIFQRPLRCVVPATSVGNASVACEPLLVSDQVTYFDYPTYNPLMKMDPNYRFFYGIAPKNTSASRWFDSIVKFDREKRVPVAQWSDESIFVTEAGFVPRTTNGQKNVKGKKQFDEDDGVLLSILYNATSDSSSVGIFDAKDLQLLLQYPLSFTVPFHAHGISCARGFECWTNP